MAVAISLTTSVVEISTQVTKRMHQTTVLIQPNSMQTRRLTSVQRTSSVLAATLTSVYVGWQASTPVT